MIYFLGDIIVFFPWNIIDNEWISVSSSLNPLQRDLREWKKGNEWKWLIILQYMTLKFFNLILKMETIDSCHSGIVNLTHQWKGF